MRQLAEVTVFGLICSKFGFEMEYYVGVMEVSRLVKEMQILHLGITFQ